jgi:hypothetical protein
MTENWPTITVIAIFAAFIYWWYSTQIARLYERYCDVAQAQTARSVAMESVYRRSMDLSEEANRLRADEIAMLRELVAALRDRK